MTFKILFIFERIMVLRIGHRTGFKPAIEYFRNAAHRAAARTGNRDFIDKLFV